MEAKGNSDLAERLLYEGAKMRSVDCMFWKGTDINRFAVEPETSRFCRPDILLRNNEVVRLNTDVYSIKPKILLRQTSDTLIAAMDRKGVWFGRSLIAIVKRTSSHSLEYLLGLLNSKYLRLLYSDLVHEAGRVFAQVKLSKLNQLPIRKIDFDNPGEAAAHESLSKMVKDVEDLTSRLSVSTGHTRTVLARQLEAQLTMIDEMVYELYDVSTDEIRKCEQLFS